MSVQIDNVLGTMAITIGSNTLYFKKDDYAALADAIFCNPPPNVVWQSQMTSEMVSGMSPYQIDEMTRTLDESVERALDDYELENV